MLSNLNCHQRGRRNSVAIKEIILRDFNMALDELNIWNIEVASGGWFGEKLDKNVNLFNGIFIMIKFIYFLLFWF